MHRMTVAKASVVLGIALALFLPAMGSDLDGVRVLSWTGYVGEQEWSNLRQVLYEAGAVVSETDTLEADGLLELLGQNEALLLPEQALAGWGSEEMDRVGESLAPAFWSHLSAGGTIVALTYMSGGEDILRSAGLTTAEDARIVTNERLVVVAPDDPLAEGVPETFRAPSLTTDFSSVDADARIIVTTDDGAPVVFALERAGGEIVILGFDFFEGGNLASKALVRNAIRGTLPVECLPLEDYGLTGLITVGEDEDFADIPGIRGTGSAADPYVISGEFDATGKDFGLRIRCTSRHFVIEDALFYGADGAGLWLEDVRNGWVVRSVFENNQVGVRAEGRMTNVTFTLNSFQNNGAHVVDDARGVAWDDGRIGNWWDGYTGLDDNADGIGDEAWEIAGVDAPGGWTIDRYPLASPLAGVEPPDGAVLLQLEHRVGKTFLRAVELDTEFEMEILGMSFPMRLRSSMVVEQEVVRQYGAGSYFDVRSRIVKDTGSATVMGMPDDYPSDEGLIFLTREYRFGDYEELDGDAIAQGVVPGMSRPARWITVGDTWNHSAELDPEDLGLPGGTGTYSGEARFDRLEERAGMTLAVLNIEGEYSAHASEEDVEFGFMEYFLRGTLSFIEFIDVASGRTIEDTSAMTLDGLIEAAGEEVGSISLRVTSKSSEFLPTDPPQASAALTAIDRALGVVIVSLEPEHEVVSGDRLKVYGVIRMADGTEIEEQRGLLEVFELVGTDRAVCRIVDEVFTFQIGDRVRPAPSPPSNG